MKRAIVTLAVGERFQSAFERYCRANWTQYAHKYGLGLIVLTEPLDHSERARRRSVSWQKCLLLSQPAVRAYDQVAWLDADILISPRSPNVFDGVGPEQVGAVDAYSTPNPEDARLGLERLYERYAAHRIPFVSNLTAAEYHRTYGLENTFDSVVQCGVLVLTPTKHQALLEDVYNRYEDKGGAEWNYEMRPLSFELLRNNVVRWLDPKFNMPWPFIRQFWYPFLEPPTRRGNWIAERLKSAARAKMLSDCATIAFLNSYFLHFAGTADEMSAVDQRRQSVYEE